MSQNKDLPEVNISTEPTSIEEFVKLRDELATTPEGGAAMFVLAMKAYQENQGTGLAYLVCAIDKSRLTSSASEGYKGYTIGQSDMWLVKTQLTKNNYLAKSYFKGTSPEKDYQAKTPYVVQCQTNPYSVVDENTIKVFVKCSGADSPRPITLVKNDKGIWKAKEFSSVLVGIRPPKSSTTTKDDL